MYQSELIPIIEEVQFQRQERDWIEMYRFAFLLAGVSNLVSEDKKEPTDFLKEPPKRKSPDGGSSQMDRWMEVAKAKGVSVPDAGR